MATIYAFEWDYDGVGNRLYQKRDGAETYYAYNAANELRHFVEGGASTYFQYDARGNCTVIEKPSGATYFEYSDADLVTSIQFASGVTNYFYYDGKLRRYAMEDSKGLTYFVWDQNGMNLLAEFDAYGNTIAEYTHGHTEIDGVGSMVAAKKTDYTDPMFPVTYYQYPIYNGPTCDVMALVDENGNVVGDYEYDPWGNRLHAAETGAPNRFGYRCNWITLPDSNGEIDLTPTRPYYAPVGRFLQRDPLPHMLGRGRRHLLGNTAVAAADGLVIPVKGTGARNADSNLYPYGDGNPGRNLDPTGGALVVPQRGPRDCVDYSRERAAIDQIRENLRILESQYVNRIPFDPRKGTKYGSGGMVTNPEAVAQHPQCVQDCSREVETGWRTTYVDTLRLALRTALGGEFSARGMCIQNNLIEATRQARKLSCIYRKCGQRSTSSLRCWLYWNVLPIIPIA